MVRLKVIFRSSFQATARLHMDIKKSHSNFNLHTVPTCCGLRIAWPLSTTFLCHRLACSEESPCFPSLGEFIWTGGTLKGRWNVQRMWMFRTSSSSVLLTTY